MSRGEVVLLGLLTAAFALMGFVFAVGTPLFQNADEPAHVDLVHHYAHHPLDLADKDLRVREGTREAVRAVGLRDYAAPVSWQDAPKERPEYKPFDAYESAREPATECPVTCQQYEFVHAPSWYLGMAPVVRLIDSRPFPQVVLALRLLDVLLVVPIVALSWYAARQVWPAATYKPLAAAAVVAFFAPLAAMAAAANNDAPMLLLAAVTIALIARLLRTGTWAGLTFALGLTIGLGLLTKSHFLAIAPIAGLAVLVAPARTPRLHAVLRFGAAASIGAIWWVANLLREGAISPRGSEIARDPRPGPWNDDTLIGYAVDHLPELVGNFWGHFGWQSVEVPSPWPALLAVVLGLIVLGWLVTRSWSPPVRFDPASRMSWILAAIPLMLVAGVVVQSFAVYRSNGEVRALAGRYVYPAVPVLAIGLVAALATIVRAVRTRVEETGLRPNTLTGGGVVVMTIAAFGALAVALTGLYDTGDVGLLLDRAEATSPVASAPVVLPILLICWLAVAAAAAWRTTPLDPVPDAKKPAS